MKVVFHVFIYNNRFHTANIYELSLFLRYLLVKLPDEVFPYVRGDDVGTEGCIDVQICTMIMQLKSNRAVYDILVLLLSYPEKRENLEVEKLHVDEDEEDDKTTDVTDCYNVRMNGECDCQISVNVLRKHIRLLYQIHIIPTIIVVITYKWIEK